MTNESFSVWLFKMRVKYATAVLNENLQTSKYLPGIQRNPSAKFLRRNADAVGREVKFNLCLKRALL